jgi:NADH-quinone oxidoreductase subunit J
MSFIELVFAAFVLASAVCVVCLRNPLFSAFALVVNLFAVAGTYALLDAHFLAVSQVVVYAGAIMVLVLFVLMLLNLKKESGRSLGVLRSATAVLVGVGVIYSALPVVVNQFRAISSSAVEDNSAASVGTVKAIGEVLYTRYLVQFELSSLVLLIGIVGAVMLSRRRASTLKPRSSFTGGA